MSKVYDAMMGLVVGDALGVPFEFKQRDTFHVTDMVGYGTHNQKPGTWSDDSSLALATLESLGRCGKINPEDIMKNFADWLYDASFTAHGEVFDVGRTTRQRKRLADADSSPCLRTAYEDAGVSGFSPDPRPRYFCSGVSVLSDGCGKASTGHG